MWWREADSGRIFVLWQLVKKSGLSKKATIGVGGGFLGWLERLNGVRMHGEGHTRNRLVLLRDSNVGQMRGELRRSDLLEAICRDLGLGRARVQMRLDLWDLREESRCGCGMKMVGLL